MLRTLMAALLMAGLMASVEPALADMDPYDFEETVEAEKKALRRDERARERIDAKQEQLQHERSELKFQKRTKAPFKSQRTLRNELRSNKAQQGWEKRESRRLDYEVRRRQRNIRRYD